MPTPTATEIELESPAPSTPSGLPVSQPAIMKGASAAFSATVNTWTKIVGFTIPVPRSADPMETSANWSPRPGRNQCRYRVPAATVSASAPSVLM